MNDGAEPAYSKLDCPACGGSGHAADAATENQSKGTLKLTESEK
ncbi:hypothetical protein ACQ4WP_18975 [Janthinobacterium sp. GB4P2]